MTDADDLKEQMQRLVAKVDGAYKEIETLHDSLESQGINSRRVGDSLRGIPFEVPVDEQHKATQLPLTKCGNPHMRAFHASWFAFFSTFFSTFAPAPLATTLTKKTTLGLTRKELQYGNIASVTANIICRFLMGMVCDKLGARKGLVFCLLFCLTGLIPIFFVVDAAGFIICRALIGVGLASFVACQVWCTQQFSKNIVGTANATAGGWGNLGGGITNLLMPFIFLGFMSATNDDEDRSWRLCFIVPLALHLIASAVVMTGRDLPDGNFKELETSGAKQKSDGAVVAKVGASNINAWILTLVYAMSFGVELTMTNVASQYFYEYHGTSKTISGIIASCFGLMNLFARSLGGLTSDWANKQFGMRGRLWALFIFQALEGVICLVLGLVTLNKDAPTFAKDAPQFTGFVQHDGAWVPFNGTGINQTIEHCGTLDVQLTERIIGDLADPRLSDLTAGSSALLKTPPFGDGVNCVSNAGLLGVVILLFVLFSVAVQMAEGLCYGVVPYVSRPALGVVSGMVGAGGNAGSLITNAAFFLDPLARTDMGFVQMGAAIIGVTLLCFLVYFPEHGAMTIPKGGLGKYDPQIIKPPEGYRGADSMDFAAAKAKADEGNSSTTTSPSEVTATVSKA